MALGQVLIKLRKGAVVVPLGMAAFLIRGYLIDTNVIPELVRCKVMPKIRLGARLTMIQPSSTWLALALESSNCNAWLQPPKFIRIRPLARLE